MAHQFEKILLSMTTKPRHATLFDADEIGDAMKEACKVFPDFKLTIRVRRTGFVVASDGMNVQRWLRL